MPRGLGIVKRLAKPAPYGRLVGRLHHASKLARDLSRQGENRVFGEHVDNLAADLNNGGLPKNRLTPDKPQAWSVKAKVDIGRRNLRPATRKNNALVLKLKLCLEKSLTPIAKRKVFKRAFKFKATRHRAALANASLDPGPGLGAYLGGQQLMNPLG